MNVDFIFQELRKYIAFDLSEGPYLTGSLLTYAIESSFRPPYWRPDDIDIVCRSLHQLEALNNALSPLASTITRYNWTTDIICWEFEHHFDGIPIQAILHNVSGEDRVRWADTTITSIASDTIQYAMSPQTMEDIKHGILRENSNLTNLAGVEGGLEHIISRYDKYTSRGYLDLNNDIKKRIASL